MKRINIMLLIIIAALIILAGIITLDEHKTEPKSVAFIQKSFMLKVEGVSDIGFVKIERGVEPKPSCLMETPQFRIAARVFERFLGVNEVSFDGVYMHIKMLPEAPADGIIDEMTIVLKENLKSVAFIQKSFMLKVEGVSDIGPDAIKRGVDPKHSCMVETPRFRTATEIFKKFPSASEVQFTSSYVFINMNPKAPADGIIDEMTIVLKENLKAAS